VVVSKPAALMTSTCLLERPIRVWCHSNHNSRVNMQAQQGRGSVRGDDAMQWNNHMRRDRGQLGQFLKPPSAILSAGLQTCRCRRPSFQAL
jgi:hypothetical protein